jgi:hypothetical protein
MLGLGTTASECGSAGAGCADFSGYAAANPGYHVYDPQSQSPLCTGATGTTATCTRTQFPNDMIPFNRLSAAAQKIAAFYAPYEQFINQNVYSNNLSWGTPTGNANWYSTGRIDYNPNARNQVAAIIAFGRQSTTGATETSGLGVPFNTAQSFHPVSNIAILKDTLTISPHVINQLAIGYGRYESLSATPNQSPLYAATTLGNDRHASGTGFAELS